MGEIERLYTKERFEKMEGKFAFIDPAAKKVIDSVESKDILSFKISIASPRRVLSAKLTTPSAYLESCVV